MPNPTSLAGLEKTIGVVFRDKNLLCQALTHRSSSLDRSTKGHNERLEFLGDAVLQLIATEHALLRKGQQYAASDTLLKVGQPPAFRVAGETLRAGFGRDARAGRVGEALVAAGELGARGHRVLETHRRRA